MACHQWQHKRLQGVTIRMPSAQMVRHARRPAAHASPLLLLLPRRAVQVAAPAAAATPAAAALHGRPPGAAAHTWLIHTHRL
eukprot:280829-Chlamydomonas_euryale.AAC.1